jgi:hypothetical protein
MAVREFMNNHPRVAAVGAIILILVPVGLLLWQNTGGAAPPGTRQLYFTVDDGKNFFADNENKIPPFDYNGKPAYQAYVWTCDGGKTKFVSHLVRYTPQGKKRLSNPDPAAAAVPSAGGLGMSDTEVKKPGAPDTQWVKMSDPRAAEITTPKCLDRQNVMPELVLP